MLTLKVNNRDRREQATPKQSGGGRGGRRRELWISFVFQKFKQKHEDSDKIGKTESVVGLCVVGRQ